MLLVKEFMYSGTFNSIYCAGFGTVVIKQKDVSTKYKRIGWEYNKRFDGNVRLLSQLNSKDLRKSNKSESRPKRFRSSDIDTILSSYSASTREVKGNAVICAPDSPERKLFYVESGHVNVYSTMQGRNVKLTELKEGTFFGFELFFFDRYLFTVRTSSSATIVSIDVEELLMTCSKNSKIALRIYEQYTKYLANYVQILTKRMSYLTH